MKFNLKSLIILFCILYSVLLISYINSKEDKIFNKGRIYNVYDIEGKEIKVTCIKFEEEKDYQDFEGHYTSFFYEVTKEECE
jgi:hypothetical protein